jgi:hypothetical protein
MPVINDVDRCPQWGVASQITQVSCPWGACLRVLLRAVRHGVWSKKNGAARWRCSERKAILCLVFMRAQQQRFSAGEAASLFADDICCLNPTHCAYAQHQRPPTRERGQSANASACPFGHACSPTRRTGEPAARPGSPETRCALRATPANALPPGSVWLRQRVWLLQNP